MYVLGISALYHDSAAVLLKDEEIIAAAQEERFSRKKHDANMPHNAIQYCLEEAGIEKDDIAYIVFYDNPVLTLDRFISNIRSVDCPNDLVYNSFNYIFSHRLWINKLIQKELQPFPEKTKIVVCKHHISHAASAFYPSPFFNAIIITMDGVGEWTTLSIGVGEGKRLEIKEEIRYPHSLGLFYSAFTYYCGFKVNEGDYKFMGLAPYGKPIYYEIIKDNVIHINEDGSFKLNLDYFDFQNGRTMINEKKLSELFGGKCRRKPESRITKKDMDIAASVQKITEEVVERIAKHAKKQYGEGIDNLVLAGGVALNCVANGKLMKKNVFQNIWIQPAAGDAGGALGAAYYAYYNHSDVERKVNEKCDYQKGSYLGPEYTDEEVERFLKTNNYPFEKRERDCEKKIAQLLAEQKIIGLFHDRMEFGPRALGNRSIIADPRSEEMQSKMNMKIKYRESFRPFAPSVLLEDVEEYFDMKGSSPYMLVCADVKKERCIDIDSQLILEENNMDMIKVVNNKRSDIPAVTHVDFSARIQTVDRTQNRFYYNIINEFKMKTGCGVVVNTSFNLRGEPIVCSLEDAYKCFMRSEMDVLVLNHYILRKDNQPKFVEKYDWRNEYELD